MGPAILKSTKVGDRTAIFWPPKSSPRLGKQKISASFWTVGGVSDRTEGFKKWCRVETVSMVRNLRTTSGMSYGLGGLFCLLLVDCY